MNPLKHLTFHLLIFAFFLQIFPKTSSAGMNELYLITANSDNSLHPLEQTLDKLPYSFYLNHNPIFSLDKNNKWICRLCKEFPTIENSLLEVLDSSKNSYDLKISFEFDPKFSWGDGKPINGYDLYFTWQAAANLGHRYLGKHFFTRIQQISVDSNDPRKVTVYLRGKSSLYSDWGEIILLPKHLEKKVWLKYRNRPNTYFRHSLYRTEPFNPGLYSGYYNYSGINTLKRSNNLKTAHTAYNLIKLIKPKDFHRLKVQKEFMIPESLPKVYTNTYKQAKIEKTQVQKEVWGDSINFEHITFNLRNPVLKDKRIRWALSHGFDKNALIKNIYQNMVSPTAHFLAPQYQGFNAHIPLYEYSQKKSTKLLDEAEWVYDKDSKIRHKMGKPLKLSLLINNDPRRIATAKFLASSWEKIGVKLDIKIQKDSEFWNSIKRKSFDSMIMFAWQLPAERSYYPLFSSDAVPNIRNHYQGQNICGWANKKVDRILQKLKIEFSHLNRMKQLISLQDIFAKEVPMIPLFMPNQIALVPIKLNNFFISGNQFPSSHYVHEWVLKSETKLTTK
ncbi:MAG: ABC transporter substrate-binding protein [Oligoflexales bacterium]